MPALKLGSFEAEGLVLGGDELKGNCAGKGACGGVLDAAALSTGAPVMPTDGLARLLLLEGV